MSDHNDEKLKEAVRDTGGSAFPTLKQAGDVALTEGGLTKREYFSAKALQGILANSILLSAITKEAANNGQSRCNGIASFCYELADAMLKERNK